MSEHPREPIYNKEKSHRIISLPNGVWQLQRYGTQAGTKTFDPWVKIGPSHELPIAYNLLRATEIST